MIFNEDKLQKEIIKTWGEFGAHNEVFKAMTLQIKELKEQLTLPDVSQQRELLHTEVFNLANKLAINGFGNEAVKMHQICNGM